LSGQIGKPADFGKLLFFFFTCGRDQAAQVKILILSLADFADQFTDAISLSLYFSARLAVIRQPRRGFGVGDFDFRDRLVSFLPDFFQQIVGCLSSDGSLLHVGPQRVALFGRDGKLLGQLFLFLDAVLPGGGQFLVEVGRLLLFIQRFVAPLTLKGVHRSGETHKQDAEDQLKDDQHLPDDVILRAYSASTTG